MKQSQKNCLIIAHYDPAKDRNGALQELFTLFCLYAQKSVFYFSGTRNPVSSVRKTKDIKII